MAKYVFYQSNLSSYYKELIDFNISQRTKIENNKTLSAINMNIILCLACYLEGILEDRGNMLLGYNNVIHNTVNLDEFELRKPFNVIHHNISDFFHHKISQTTGIDNFDKIFEIFLDESLKQNSNIKPLIEGINVLFQLRNVIAHGRQAYAYEIEAYYTNGVEEHFNGGYKKAEEYLIKKNLISQKFVDMESVEIYFSNDISNHFFDLVQNFIIEVDNFIKNNLIIADSIKEKLKKYNEDNACNINMYDYFRMYGV